MLSGQGFENSRIPVNEYFFIIKALEFFLPQANESSNLKIWKMEKYLLSFLHSPSKIEASLQQDRSES
jgi:hypothetical protein